MLVILNDFTFFKKKYLYYKFYEVIFEGIFKSFKKKIVCCCFLKFVNCPFSLKIRSLERPKMQNRLSDYYFFGRPYDQKKSKISLKKIKLENKFYF